MRRLPDAEPRPCESCGEAFTPRRKSPGRRFCSGYCQRRASLRFDDPEVQRQRSRLSAERRGDAQRGTGEGKGYRKHGGIHEHRVAAARMLGRPLLPEEIVHHRDGDKLNNDESNLRVFPNQAAHARFHRLGQHCQPGCPCRRHPRNRGGEPSRA